jgi:hypothetical protein
VPGYALYIELREGAESAQLEKIRARAEEALCGAASDYARLRRVDHLAALQIRALPAGTYERVRQARVLDGSAEAQLKTAHLVDDARALPDAVRAAASLD